MLNVLENIIPKVLQNLNDENSINEWDSLVINRKKPWTYRIFTHMDGYRVCLHCFKKCEPSEALAHPHPWPGAFLILHGSYVHTIGASPDLESEPTFFYREILRSYSMYEIVNQKVWHSVQPLEETYTIMVNGDPWNLPHSKVRTTHDKGLISMEPDELKSYLEKFKILLKNYLEKITLHS